MANEEVTCAGGFVWVTDEDDSSQVSSTEFVQIPLCIGIGIDIMPGSETNSIRPWSRGSVAVAILSKPGFNATTEIDESSLRFGSKGHDDSLVKCFKKDKDLNGDSLLDLVCHFNVADGAFVDGDREGILAGKTVGNVPILGSDSVQLGHAALVA